MPYETSVIHNKSKVYTKDLRDITAYIVYTKSHWPKQELILTRNGNEVTFHVTSFDSDGNNTGLRIYESNFVESNEHSLAIPNPRYELDTERWKTVSINSGTFESSSFPEAIGHIVYYGDHFPRQILFASRDELSAVVKTWEFDSDGLLQIQDEYTMTGYSK